MAVSRRPASLSGATTTVLLNGQTYTAPLGWEYSGVAVPRGRAPTTEELQLGSALQQQHEVFAAGAQAYEAAIRSAPISKVGEAPMIQLGNSSMFVPGDFSGSLPGSSGGSGSAILEIIGQGIGLTTEILRNRNSNVAMSQLPSVPATIGPAIAGGAAGAVGGVLVQKGIDLFLTGPNVVNDKKRRRMNVLNPYALGRSMRRVRGFAKFARKTIQLTSRVKMKRAPSPRRKKR